MLFLLCVLLLSSVGVEMSASYRAGEQDEVSSDAAPGVRSANWALMQALAVKDNQEALKIVAEELPDLNACYMSGKKSLLCMAIESGDPGIATPMIHKYARYSSSDYLFYASALHSAVTTLDRELVRIMLSIKMGNKGVASHENYIHEVIQRSASQPDMRYVESYLLIRLLLGNPGIVENVRRYYLKELLHDAVDYQRHDILELLVAQRNPLDVQKLQDALIIKKAFAQKSPRLVEAILGRCVWRASKYQKLLIQYALDTNDVDVVRLVLRKITDCDLLVDDINRPDRILDTVIKQERAIAIVKTLIEYLSAQSGVHVGAYGIVKRPAINGEKILSDVVSKIDESIIDDTDILFHDEYYCHRVQDYYRSVAGLLIRKRHELGISNKYACDAAQQAGLLQLAQECKDSKEVSSPFYTRTVRGW